MLFVLSVYYFDFIYGWFELITFKKGSGPIIIDLLLEDGMYLIREGGLLPSGFIQLWWSPILGHVNQELPEEILRNEVAILTVIFQMGIIGTLLWLAILYVPLFKRGSFLFANDYKVLLLLSAIGFSHHLTILKPAILIFLLFCGIQAEKKSKL